MLLGTEGSGASGSGPRTVKGTQVLVKGPAEPGHKYKLRMSSSTRHHPTTIGTVLWGTFGHLVTAASCLLSPQDLAVHAHPWGISEVSTRWAERGKSTCGGDFPLGFETCGNKSKSAPLDPRGEEWGAALRLGYSQATGMGGPCSWGHGVTGSWGQ